MRARDWHGNVILITPVASGAQLRHSIYPSEPTAIGAALAAERAAPDPTVVRIVGRVTLNQSGVQYQGAMGIIQIKGVDPTTAPATYLGAADVPDPISDVAADWLWWKPFATYGAADVEPMVFDLDVLAKRRLGRDSILAFVLESSPSSISSISVHAGFRALLLK